jgi:ArsR family transcriptional regulator
MDEDRLAEHAELLKAVAHPVRLTILAELARGPKCVAHIRELLDVPQPNVSQHLTVLRHGGLVACYREGVRRCYYLTRPSLVEALLAVLRRDHRFVKPSKRAVVAAAERSRGARRP